MSNVPASSATSLGVAEQPRCRWDRAGEEHGTRVLDRPARDELLRALGSLRVADDDHIPRFAEAGRFEGGVDAPVHRVEVVGPAAHRAVSATGDVALHCDEVIARGGRALERHHVPARMDAYAGDEEHRLSVLARAPHDDGGRSPATDADGADRPGSGSSGRDVPDVPASAVAIESSVQAPERSERSGRRHPAVPR